MVEEIRVLTPDEVHTCPECHGTGERFGGTVFRCDCRLCRATGKVSGRTLEWRRIGEQMSQDRRRRDRSLREEARERQMPVLVLGDMEHGYIEPRPR